MGLDQDSNNLGLHLVLGLSLNTKETTNNTNYPPISRSSTKANDNNLKCLKPTNEPSLTLGLSGESYNHQQQQQVQVLARNNKILDGNNDNNNKTYNYCEVEPVELSRQASSPHSVVSSFSSGRVVVKRERDLSFEEVELAEAEERVSSRVSDEDEDGTNARKKLRLTKEQSALLEESFKQHSTLNPVTNLSLSLYIRFMVCLHFSFQLTYPYKIDL